MSDDVIHDCEAVHGYVSRICFKNGPPARVGAELEFLLAGDQPEIPISLARVRACLLPALPFPGGSSLTFEPGGQVELSSPPARSLTSLVTGLAADVDHLTRTLGNAGLRMLDTAVDPLRPPRRQLVSPRYDAMESYFDGLEPGSPADERVGRTMMCSTAAIQVNLDAGSDPAARWRLLHDLGPVLLASFANSPTRLGRPTGWKSTRQQVWLSLDPRRTAPIDEDEPVAAYAERALDAEVMLQPGRGTLRDWVESSDPPSVDDLAQHLSTLFPPVRPRGWFEVRFIDAQPVRWWPVPIAVLGTLLDDPVAADLAAEAAEPARGRWESAARSGLDDPVLDKAATRCFEIARDSLSRHEPLLTGLVDGFADEYVARGRCPADDQLPASQSGVA